MVRLFYRTQEGFVSFRGTVSAIMSGFCVRWKVMDDKRKQRECVFSPLCACVNICLLFVFKLVQEHECTLICMHVCARIRGPAWMCVYAWMHSVHVYACVCVRPVVGHPSRQVSGRISASLQWPGGNLEEKRWITGPHWGNKTARLSPPLPKHTQTLMGKHSQNTHTLLSQSERRRREEKKNTQEGRQGE